VKARDYIRQPGNNRERIGPLLTREQDLLGDAIPGIGAEDALILFGLTHLAAGAHFRSPAPQYLLQGLDKAPVFFLQADAYAHVAR
jgi:hypothetical protein